MINNYSANTKCFSKLHGFINVKWREMREFHNFTINENCSIKSDVWIDDRGQLLKREYDKDRDIYKVIVNPYPYFAINKIYVEDICFGKTIVRILL